MSLDPLEERTPMCAARHHETREVLLTLPVTLWRALPSNTAEFDALTPAEEGALRSLLAAIWLTPAIEEVFRDEP